MRLLLVSHKPCWGCGADTGYCTDGGFPLQAEAISGLFDRTIVLVTESRLPEPPDLQPLIGYQMSVTALPEPRGRGILRKLCLGPWLLRWFGSMWRAIGSSDAVHAAVPGDIGVLGLMAAVMRKKPLFVRYCGTWNDRSTLASRFLAWFLPRIAGGRTVVMATGGGLVPPEPRNRSIEWIYATSLSKSQLDNMRQTVPWREGETLRLVTVGRLTAGKNARACIEALPRIQRWVPDAELTVVGDGPLRGELEALAGEIGVGERVSFRGNLGHEGVLDILSDSHIFLFPTRVAEGFPKAVLEAMACGLPVVASEVSVLPHLLSDGCGIILAGTSAKDVVAAVSDLIDRPEGLAHLGMLARERAKSFSLEGWSDLIGGRLERAWGCRLKSSIEEREKRTDQFI